MNKFLRLRQFKRPKNSSLNDKQTAITKGLKIITDEAVTEDALDFHNYSQNLADIIRNSNPRFTVGIFGHWRTGKTSLMRMIEQELKNDRDMLVVWFEAWKYEKEEYLAVIPFLRTVQTRENIIKERLND
jgi:predicted KAP-like P-loop ATPase